MSECLAHDDLPRFENDSLDSAQRKRWEAHLAECDRCKAALAEYQRNESYLGQVGWALEAPTDADGTVPIDPTGKGRRANAIPDIEGYQIVRELHRGGQGVVYQAVQTSTKRKVAIKLLLDGRYASKSARKRFEREIELVGQLKHPNIIGIFHSGTTLDDRQFCVMDYVRGVPLRQFVRDKKLGLEDALKLFGTVCDAVNYAHQRGVIHRDLKPSNIIVDTGGVPKVLDFGLAKQLASPVESLVSVTGQVVGTLPYMSPEQARGNPDEIDIRTDVYALGVILYEILTGHYPYPVVGQMAKVLKHIEQTPPTPPSRQWKVASGITKRSSKRLRPGQCPIDDELQTVVLKTLSKERERRYQSAGELGRDVGNYLSGQPIEARRDSGWYVLKKTLRRYKLPVAVVAAFVLLVSASTLALWIMYANQTRARMAEVQQRQVAEAAEREQSRARKEAEEARATAEEHRILAEANEATAKHEAAKAQAVSNFLQNMLGSVDPGQTGGPEVSVGYLLEQAVAKLNEGALKNQPEAEGAARYTIGYTYLQMGRFAEAAANLRLSMALRREALGERSAEVAQSTDILAVSLAKLGELTEAETLSRQALRTRRELFGQDHRDLAESLTNLGNIIGSGGAYAKAEDLQRQALSMRRRLFGSEHLLVAEGLNNLAMLLQDKGDYAAAEPLMREAMAIRRKLLGDEHPEVATTLNNLALLLQDKGDYAAAEPLYREALAMTRKLLGDEHPIVANSQTNLGALLRTMGKLDDAESLLRQAITTFAATEGDDHWFSRKLGE